MGLPDGDVRIEHSKALDLSRTFRPLQVWSRDPALQIARGSSAMANVVAWHLAGEPRADDHRMVELLRPFKGNRGRVLRLIGTLGSAPKRGPRVALRTRF